MRAIVVYRTQDETVSEVWVENGEGTIEFHKKSDGLVHKDVHSDISLREIGRHFFGLRHGMTGMRLVDVDSADQGKRFVGSLVSDLPEPATR